MNLRRHRKTLFIGLGAAMLVITVALNVSWIVLNWRAGLQLFLGVILFGIIMTGVVLNTAFLVREIRRNEQHNNFINAVTHELKTPVASMRLYLETLQARPVGEERRKQFYGAMLEDTERLMHTIDQVLKAGQVTSGRRMDKTAVSLSETIGQCLSLAQMRHRLTGTSLRFTNLLAKGSPDLVQGDEADLRTAILNLLDNAVKYSEGDPNILVELDRGQRQSLLVRVKDQGIGIPSDELKNVFHRFHRIQNATTARIKGTGLGLFIVHSIAKRHKGRVAAESLGHGHGSTFTLELPAMETPLVSAEAAVKGA